jgi:hypothetical protein
MIDEGTITEDISKLPSIIAKHSVLDNTVQ